MLSCKKISCYRPTGRKELARGVREETEKELILLRLNQGDGQGLAQNPTNLIPFPAAGPRWKEVPISKGVRDEAVRGEKSKREIVYK